MITNLQRRKTPTLNSIEDELRDIIRPAVDAQLKYDAERILILAHNVSSTVGYTPNLIISYINNIVAKKLKNYESDTQKVCQNAVFKAILSLGYNPKWGEPDAYGQGAIIVTLKPIHGYQLETNLYREIIKLIIINSNQYVFECQLYGTLSEETISNLTTPQISFTTNQTIFNYTLIQFNLK